MAILDLSTYKAFQGINADKNDAKITSSINAVNTYIPSYCNRTFVDYYSTNKVEYFDASMPEYYPEEFPIQTVVSIKYSSLYDGNYDKTLVEHKDYVVDFANSRIVSLDSEKFITTSYPVNSGEITYTGGYEDYPVEIIQAAVMLVEYYMEEAYTPRKSHAGSSVDSLIQPDFTAKLPPHIRRILEHHRAFVM